MKHVDLFAEWALPWASQDVQKAERTFEADASHSVLGAGPGFGRPICGEILALAWLKSQLLGKKILASMRF